MDEYGERDWEEGTSRPRCQGKRANGSRCTLEELPDLGYCLSHAPDDLIPLAEQISGRTRCTGKADSAVRNGVPNQHQGQRCGAHAIPGGTVCYSHGGKLPPVRRAAFENVLNRTSEDILRRIVKAEQKTGQVMRVGASQPLDNPFLELMAVAAEMKAFKDRIGVIVADMTIEQWRYEHDRAGEQLRAEVAVYVKAMDQLAVTLMRIAKLNIEERMMAITGRQAEIIEQALMRTLADPEINLPAELQKLARDQVVRRLRVA